VEPGDIDKLSDDELFKLLGEAITADEVDALEHGPKYIVTKGRVWLKKNLGTIRQTVCSDPKIQAYLRKEHYDKEEAAAVVIDSLNPMSLGVPVAVVGVLLSRIGLRSMCSGDVSGE